MIIHKVDLISRKHLNVEVFMVMELLFPIVLTVTIFIQFLIKTFKAQRVIEFIHFQTVTEFIQFQTPQIGRKLYFRST